MPSHSSPPPCQTCDVSPLSLVSTHCQTLRKPLVRVGGGDTPCIPQQHSSCHVGGPHERCGVRTEDCSKGAKPHTGSMRKQQRHPPQVAAATAMPTGCQRARRAGGQLSRIRSLSLQQPFLGQRLVVQSARAQQLLRVLAVALQRLGQYSHLDVARTFGCDVQCDASSAGLLGAVTSPWSPFIEGTP